MRAPSEPGRSLGSLTAAVVLVVALALAACSRAAATDSSTEGADGPLVVHLFGDSLTWEAEAGLREQLAEGYDLQVTAFGGIGICDLADEITTTAEDGAADVILLQFSGNAFTSCMYTAVGPPDDAERLARYRADAASAIEVVSGAGIPLILVGTPPMPDWHPPSPDDVYRELAADAAARDLDVTYLDAGPSLEGPDGTWAASLPCLPIESTERGCSEGTIRVRAADEVHFCPGSLAEADGTVTACDRWSSGAWRYASAMADEVRGRFPTR